MRFTFISVNENGPWYIHINYGYFPFVWTDWKFRSRNRSAIVIKVYLLLWSGHLQTNDLITKWSTKRERRRWGNLFSIRSTVQSALSLICSIYFYTKDSVNEQCVCISVSLVKEMRGHFFRLSIIYLFIKHFLSFFTHLSTHLFIALSSSQFLCSKGKYRGDGKSTPFTL